MNYENSFKDMLESIPEYRKIVLLIFIFQNDKKLLHEIRFSERDINCLNLEKLEFKNILMEHHEYLDYVRNEEESVIEKFLTK